MVALRLAGLLLAVAYADDTCSPDDGTCAADVKSNAMLQMRSKVDNHQHKKSLTSHQHDKKAGIHAAQHHTSYAMHEDMAIVKKMTTKSKIVHEMQKKASRLARKNDKKGVYEVRQKYKRQLEFAQQAHQAKGRHEQEQERQKERRALARHSAQAAVAEQTYKQMKKAGGKSNMTMAKQSPCDKSSALCDATETLCYDDTTNQTFCHPMADGCPVSCLQGENTCTDGNYNPPFQWCSGSACPLVCPLTDVTCFDEATATEFCNPISMGCPITCAEGEIACEGGSGGMDRMYPPYFWCQAAPCPVYCNYETETTCYDEVTGHSFCAPYYEGCPVHCSDCEFKCTESIAGEAPLQWCQETECPPQCMMTETMCFDPTTDRNVCIPKSAGCPVTCAAGENVCHSAPWCETCSGSNWCSTSDCPTSCDYTQAWCWDPVEMSNFCMPREEGCPADCGDGYHSCESPSYEEGDAPYRWCQEDQQTCPLSCEMGDAHCYTPEGDFCAPGATGCPVTCPDGERACHERPTCHGCWGSNFCVPNDQMCP